MPTNREVQGQIAAILKQISALYEQAAALADAHGVDFSYSGPAGYGDGGYYTPRPLEGSEEWTESQEWQSSDAFGWKASSQSC